MSSNPYQSTSRETKMAVPLELKTRISLWRPNLVLAASPFVATLVYWLFTPTAIRWAHHEYRRAVSRGLKVTEDELMLQLEIDLVTACIAFPYVLVALVTGAVLSVVLRRKGIKRYSAGIALATVPLIGGIAFILNYTLSAR